MRAIITRLNTSPVRQRTAILEGAVYLVLAVLWTLVSSAEYPGRMIVGSLAVAAPAGAAVVQILFSLPYLREPTRRIWIFLALALAGWTLRHLTWIVISLTSRSDPPSASAADVFGLLAYPLAFYGLLQFSGGFRHAPLRFRFLLDMVINAGVVVTLGWLFLSRTISLNPLQLVPILYPIADFVLLMTVINLSLAGRMSKSAALILSLSVVGLAMSDYAYSFLAIFNSYRTGTITSLGWIIAYLLLGNEAIRERQRSQPSYSLARQPLLDLGTQFQNILPVTLVLALFWYVLTDWQLRGQISGAGFLMSFLFSVVLIVRLGIRAGEVELYKYWQLFSNLAEPAMICDLKGGILLGNPALARLSGGEEIDSPLAGRTVFALFSGPEFSPDTLTAASREPVTLEVDCVIGEAPYSLTLSPIFGEGRLSMIAGVAHDLSQQRQQQNAIQTAFEELQIVHQQLADLNTQLEARVEERTRTLSDAYRRLEDQHRALQELDSLKTDFVSMVSHELRTPLNNLGGGVELLMSRQGGSRSDRNTLDLMQAEIRRLTRFVVNILNLSALDAGRLYLHPVPLSLSVVIEEFMQNQLRGPGADRIDIRVHPDLPLVLADQAALESVLHHLVDNAIKYAVEGPILIEALHKAGRVKVQVTDCGPGVPDDKRHLLFQKFQRLAASDNQSVYGYGLGLYLSRRLLEAMESSLDYEAPGERGARFSFFLRVSK